jgi:hypothetical protein
MPASIPRICRGGGRSVPGNSSGVITPSHTESIARGPPKRSAKCLAHNRGWRALKPATSVQTPGTSASLQESLVNR